MQWEIGINRWNAMSSVIWPDTACTKEIVIVCVTAVCYNMLEQLNG